MALSLKLAVLSASVFSTAILFNLLSSFFMNFTISDLPIIWTSLTTCLKPPYLYVLINCIIITIVASSRLHSKHHAYNYHEYSRLSTFPIPPHEPVKLPPVHGGVVDNEPVDIVDETLDDQDMKIAKELASEEIIKKNKVNNKSVISMSVSDVNQVGLFSPVEKPPASTRFSNRKAAKAVPEGGRPLGVAKPKRQDTLETTWKTITEGRSVPLTRHLRKSDTWETHGQGRNNRTSNEFLTDNDYSERMTKSETFDVNRGKPVKPPVGPPSKLNRSGELRKEPSLGQEELNRKVEAFIKKFNEDMRLQRQESLNQYMEMINRGAH